MATSWELLRRPRSTSREPGNKPILLPSFTVYGRLRDYHMNLILIFLWMGVGPLSLKKVYSSDFIRVVVVSLSWVRLTFKSYAYVNFQVRQYCILRDSCHVTMGREQTTRWRSNCACRQKRWREPFYKRECTNICIMFVVFFPWTPRCTITTYHDFFWGALR